MKFEVISLVCFWFWNQSKQKLINMKLVLVHIFHIWKIFCFLNFANWLRSSFYFCGHISRRKAILLAKYIKPTITANIKLHHCQLSRQHKLTKTISMIRAGPRRLANDWKKHPEINFAKFLRTPFYRIRPGDLTLY